MNSPKTVMQIINSLTDDEDDRQSLWVYYLNGNSVESLSTYLAKIKKEFYVSQEIEQRILYIMHNGDAPKIDSILANFSPYEQGLMCLLMLGLSVIEISNLKGISEVRIRQSLATIRYNPYWEKQYGIKKEPNRRRKIRTDRRRDKTST